MPVSKKVIIFIAEGVTDESALQPILSKMFKDMNIHFHVVHGDITSHKDSLSNNIEQNICERVTEEMYRKKFLMDDIKTVVHIIDTDGAFVDDSVITIDKQLKDFAYDEKNIYCNDFQKAKNRNDRKTSILAKLSSITEVENASDCTGVGGKLPYAIYFFSRNREHCLDGICQNLSDSDKEATADDFADRYEHNPDDFLALLNSEEICVVGNYQETWNFIRTGLHSLERNSNFHLFFEDKS